MTIFKLKFVDTEAKLLELFENVTRAWFHWRHDVYLQVCIYKQITTETLTISAAAATAFSCFFSRRSSFLPTSSRCLKTQQTNPPQMITNTDR